MTLRIGAFALLLVACSSPAKPPSTASNVAPPADRSKLGAHGAVCALGNDRERTSGRPAPVQCGAGLECCYPCGTDGCDDICMTPDECNVKRP